MERHGLEVTQADTRIHVDGGETKVWSSGMELGMSHEHVRHCSVHMHTASLSQQCHRLQVNKPGAPTGTDDKRCDIDSTIIRGCLRTMSVTLWRGPTGLVLGVALTNEKTDAADLLRASLEREARSARKLAVSDNDDIEHHGDKVKDANVDGECNENNL